MANQRIDDVFNAVNLIESSGKTMPSSIRIAFLRNLTIEGIEVFLKYQLYRNNIQPEIRFGGFGTMTQDVLSDESPINEFDPDIIVVSLTLAALDPNCLLPGWTAEAVRSEMEALITTLTARTRAIIVLNTFLEPLFPLSGFLLNRNPSHLEYQVSELNRHIMNKARALAPRFCVVDWNRYLRLVGSAQALDMRADYLWRAPFKGAFLDLYAQQIARIACALKGHAKKCLILDCDNTLWGGIIGEDGLDGILLEPHDFPGRAFSEFQATILHLIDRGILVALCSKNNASDVFDVLDNHPGSRIKREHLAAWRINWQDKATNIREIAAELNLGLDAFVFVDDSAIECELVTSLLPEVTVLQVPAKLHELSTLLIRDGLFDTLGATSEDKQRTRLYQSESRRQSEKQAFSSVEEYLVSLETVAHVHRASSAEIARVSQLTQKTNQFNLTTRRYSEHEIRSFAEDPHSAVYSLSARDRFGELGLVGALIIVRAGPDARIDTFVMSCRALGRGLERAMVVVCLNEIRAEWSPARFLADYLPTSKNAQVSSFWTTIGFSELASSHESTAYVRDPYVPLEPAPAYITINPI